MRAHNTLNQIFMYGREEQNVSNSNMYVDKLAFLIYLLVNTN